MKTTPVIPDFKPGDRVVLSDEGARWNIADPGTKGTVVKCGRCVHVQQDGEPFSMAWAPDFWRLCE